MPYSDRWGITADKLGANTYAVTHPTAVPTTVTITIDQVFPNEAINVGCALARAIITLFPKLPSPWDLRYAYSVARWKMDAYASLISGASGSTRTQLTTKRNVWVAEEARLKAIMGADA